MATTSESRAGWTAAAGVGVVALTAAVISFTHVRHLALDAGETQLASWLLPISIDGAIVAAVAVILADSRAGRQSAALTWVLLGLGLAGSLTANIASAEPSLTARAVAAWPPVGLALGIEVLSGLVRRQQLTRAPVPAGVTAQPRIGAVAASLPIVLTLREEVGDTYHPCLKVQVKTSINAREDADGNLVYDLDTKTHNILCKTNHSTRRTLVVVKVSADGDRVRLADDGTLLVGKAAWVSLEGSEPSENAATQAVTLPAANTVDVAGLRRMLETYGVRATTEVPDFNPWEDEA